MDYTNLIVPGIVLLLGGRFLYGRLKYGSWTGSFLKGTIESTSGELQLTGRMGVAQKLTVYAMRNEDSGDSFVGFVISLRAFLGASMQPYKLTKTQASELASYLTKAAA